MILLQRFNACSRRSCSGVFIIVNDDKVDTIVDVGLIVKIFFSFIFCCNGKSGVHGGTIDRFCIFSDERCSKARTCLKTRPANSPLS